MSGNKPNDIEDEMVRLLQAAFDHRSSPPEPPRPPKGQRRFRFGVGLLLLALFCLVVAGFPWSKVELVDHVMWIGFALTLILLGSWQIDKSNKESSSPDDQDPSHPDDGPSSTVPQGIRRVK